MYSRSSLGNRPHSEGDNGIENMGLLGALAMSFSGTATSSSALLCHIEVMAVQLANFYCGSLDEIVRSKVSTLVVIIMRGRRRFVLPHVTNHVFHSPDRCIYINAT